MAGCSAAVRPGQSRRFCGLASNAQVNTEAPRPTRPFLDHTLSGVPPSPSLKRRLRRKRFKPGVGGGA